MADFYLNDKQYKAMMEATFGKGNNRKKDDDDDLLLTAATKTEKPKQQGFLGDFVDSVQMGMWQGVSDLSRAVGVASDSKWFNETADWAAKKADDNLRTMSPEMQKALQQSAFDGVDEDSEGMGVLNARWWAGNIGSMLGANADIALTLGGSALLTTGAKVAGKAALKTISKESAEKIGQAAIEQATKRGLPAKYKYMVGATAAMSAMQAGSRANSAIEEYLTRADEEVVNDEIFRQTYHDLKNSEEGQGLDHDSLFDLAKEKVAHQVGRSAALNPTAVFTDITTNAVAGLGGGVLGLGSAAKTLKGGLLKGAITEGATEAAQGAVEQYAINQAAKEHYDFEQDVTAGMADNAVNSAIIGGGFGAPMGMVDTVNHRMAVGKQKKELLKMVHTGNEAIDEQLKNYVEMVNQTATDLADLVATRSRVYAKNIIGTKEARAKKVMLEQQPTENNIFGFNESTVAQQNEVAEPIVPTVPITTESAVEITPDFNQFQPQNLAPQIQAGEQVNATQIAEPLNEQIDNAIIKPTEANANSEVVDEIERVWKGKQNGQPFLSAKEAEMSKTFKDAKSGGLNPVVIDRDGAFLVEMDDVNQFAHNDNDFVSDDFTEDNIDSYYERYNGGYDDSPRFSRSAMKSVEANIKRGREAMTKAILDKATVHRAMYRNDLDGWVDFEWGGIGRTLPGGKTKGAMGLSHILDKRMSIDGMTEQEAVSFLIDDITETIAKGSAARETNFGKTKTVQIVYNGNEVKLAKKQGNNGWVITGFKQFQPMNQSRGATTSDLRNSDPIRSRIEMGATGLNTTIPLNDQTVNVADTETNRYSFAGENAKTADHSLLAEAKSAVENGKNPEIVRQQTGWFKGVDDKWRFEIDDSEVRFLDKDIEIGADLFYLLGSRIHKLRHVIQADALFSAYPELKDVGIKASNLEGNNSGYSRSQNLIYLDRNLSGEQAKSILLHEIQHIIQHIEDFAYGTNLQKASGKTEKELAIRKYEKLRSEASPQLVEAFDAFLTSESEYLLDEENQQLGEKYAQHYEDLVRNHIGGFDLFNAYEQMNSSTDDPVPPLEVYRKTAGEVEARNVQTRMNMTAEERLNRSPESTEDVNIGC